MTRHKGASRVAYLPRVRRLTAKGWRQDQTMDWYNDERAVLVSGSAAAAQSSWSTAPVGPYAWQRRVHSRRARLPILQPMNPSSSGGRWWRKLALFAAAFKALGKHTGCGVISGTGTGRVVSEVALEAPCTALQLAADYTGGEGLCHFQRFCIKEWYTWKGGQHEFEHSYTHDAD
jgi:hypothetical protein